MLLDIMWVVAKYGDIKTDSANRIKICIDSKSKNVRLAVLNTIEKELQSLGSQYLNDMPHYSSIGYVKVSSYLICVKSKLQQGSLSCGIKNEDFLDQKINKYIKDYGPINIKFIGKNCCFLCENVGSSECTKNKKVKNKKIKADINLHSSKIIYSFSLKQKDAERWESSDSNKGIVAKEKIDQAIQNGITKLENVVDQRGNNIYRNGDINKPVMKLTKELYWEFDKEESEYILFGDDLQSNHGAVLIQTFEDSNFTYDEKIKTLNVKCDKIYTKNTEIEEEDKPCWYIRNDITRNSKKIGIMGVRIESVFKSRIKYGVEI